MEIINEYINEPFTSEPEMDSILEGLKVVSERERKQRIDTILDVSKSNRDCSEFETTSRKPIDVIPSATSVAPERPFKPRKKREIF